MIQSETHIAAVVYFDVFGPPSSPPMNTLLAVKIIKQMTDVNKNIATEKPSLPAGTMYVLLSLEAYIALITHGRPRPKNTFTELEPVTFPTAESAYGDDLAAVTLAKVSGRDVPMATIVIAVIYGSKDKTHPSNSAISPTIPVIIPIIVSAIMKAYFPSPHLIGGIIAKSNFQVTKRN